MTTSILAVSARRLSLTIALVLALSVMLPDVGLGQEIDSSLRGEYAVTIAPDDIPPELIEGASLIGRWRIAFGDDGAYVFGRQDVGALARGQFETDGHRLTLRGETGVIACEPGADDVGAIYEWQIRERRLLLSAVEEPCDRRRLLLTTRTLSAFAPCPPLSANDPDAADEPQNDDSNNVRVATPVVAASIAPERPDVAIDTLLKQMSDCWATRQPERFLHLLSADFRDAQSPGTEDDKRRYILNMSAPIVWDLAGEVELIDADHATAMVRQSLGDTIDVVRYVFVFEHGRWRWDGMADPP